METADQRSRRNYARRDAAVVIAATLLAAIICAKFDLGEALTGWTRPYERLQLDELPKCAHFFRRTFMSTTEIAARIGVLLVDDHAVVREGYRRLLERDVLLNVIGEASSAADALRLDAQLQPDVIVLDIALPGVSGIEILRRIVSRRPDACVLMFSMYQDGIYATRALQSGARGYVSKASAPELLIEAVRTVASGQRFVSPDVEAAMSKQRLQTGQLADALSTRELEVLGLLTQGLRLDEIGERLGLSPKTAANHQSSIKQKLGASSALQLVLIAQQYGLDSAK